MVSSDRPSGPNAKRERGFIGPAFTGRSGNIWLGPKPAREGCLGSTAFDFGNTMLKLRRQTEDYGVAAARVSRLTDECSRLAVTNLKNAARINLPTQIQTHTDQPTFANIVVPGIVMSITRVDAIDPALKTTDSIALSYLLDELEKFFVVHQE